MKRQTQQETVNCRQDDCGTDGTAVVQQVWRFRREITLGTLVQLGAILIALTVGWSNLQSELALIRYDLNRLIQTNEQSQRQIENLAEQSREQEYRIKTLEEKTIRDQTSEIRDQRSDIRDQTSDNQTSDNLTSDNLTSDNLTSDI